MNVALFEDAHYRQLLPLTWLRACCELRCGRDRLIDKVRRHVGSRIARLYVRPELHEVATERLDLEEPEAGDDWCLVNARLLVSEDVVPPPPGVAWRSQGVVLAATVRESELERLSPELFLDASRLEQWAETLSVEPAPDGVCLINYPWDLVAANATELRRQCTQGGAQEGIVYAGAHLLNAAQIHVGPGSRIKPGAVLDAEAGPIHIDRNVLVLPNAVIEGPCYIGPDSTIRAGAVIRGGTSIGPVSKVGGEVSSSIFQGYSNKQHEGFLGDSFVGEWVNLGAGTVTSNLKNTYGTIRVSLNGIKVESGRHFIGAFVGDHAKTGIGTVLPTGCVIGVAANVFTQRPVPKFVPSFAWLTDEGLTACRVDKVLDIARTVTARRDCCLSAAEARLLERTAVLAREVEAAGWG